MEYLRANYKKVLNILGILLFLSAFAYVVLYFLDNNQDIAELQITNLSSNSVSISWVSDDANIATIQYSKDDNWLPLVDKILPKTQVYDDRDVVKDENNNYVYTPSIAFPRNIHHITIRNLEANTKYYFRINGNLRTYVPSVSNLITTSQLEKVVEPDPIYGNVLNYHEIIDTPFDGVIYYKIINNNDIDDFSQTYSSTITRDSSWSGDLSNILNKDGQLYKWDKDNFSVELNARTADGDGLYTYSLESYKPIDDIAVNVRYFPLESAEVLGLSTDMARDDDGSGISSGTKRPVTQNTTPGAATTTKVETKGKTTVITVVPTNGTSTSPGSSASSNAAPKTITIPTKVANTYGSNVTNSFGNSAIVEDKNGKKTPICVSSYSQACTADGSNCHYSVTCGGGGEFISGPCTCETTGSNGVKVVKPVDPKANACPVATVPNVQTGKCEGTAIGSDKETKTQDPSPGASEKVALRAGETAATQKSRAEGNAVAGVKLTGDATSSSGTTIPSACASGGNGGKGDVKAGVTCNCMAISWRVPDGNGGKYVCNDPARGWEVLEVANECPQTHSCDTLSCGLTGSYSNSDGVAKCTYGDNIVTIGRCSNGGIVNEIPKSSIEQVCSASKDLTACKARVAATTCPRFSNFGCGRSRSDLPGSSSNNGTSLNCTYTLGNAVYSFERATCNSTGEYIQKDGDPRTQLCNSDNSNSTTTDQPLVPSGATNVQGLCNNEQERKGATLGGCFTISTESNTTSCTSNFHRNDSNTTLWCANPPRTTTNTNTNTDSTTNVPNYSTVPDTQANPVTPLSNCTSSDCRPNGGGGYNACKNLGTGETNYCKEISPLPAGGNNNNSPSPCPHGPDGIGDSASCGPEDSTHTQRCSSNIDGQYKYCTVGTQGSLFNIAKKVHAQPVPEVIDPILLSKGTYRILVPGYKNAEFSILNNNVSVKYFQDDNGNGIKEESEKYIDPSSYQITVAKLSDLTTYTLQTGWNLIALNFIASDLDQASELAKAMNEQGIAVVQVSKYDNGNWVHYVFRVTDSGNSENFGNDFKLVPGEGYFVRSLSPGVISLKGQKFTSSVPINLDLGWNLASIQTTTDYTANTFIDKCNSLGANCTAVSRFTDNVYESVVKFQDKFFGNNFNLKDTEGYFVLNKSGNKTISP
ncbi:MAG: fibronectin type III domain-containing protein [Candidatus Dojkabacteria bacterium]